MPQILRCDEKGIDQFANLVKSGSVVVFPTDTVYGIGCDPRNENSVRRVFAIKQRNESKAVPILAKDFATAEKLITFGSATSRLAAKFWPGGLTIIGPMKDFSIARAVTAGSKELAVRVPNNSCLRRALEQASLILGTSANLSGRPAPKNAEEVLSSGLQDFDALLDGGQVEKGIESTIVRESPERAERASPRGLSARSVVIIREGAISRYEIFAALEDFS